MDCGLLQPPANNIEYQLIIYFSLKQFLYDIYMEEKLVCPFGDVLVQARKERGFTQACYGNREKRSSGRSAKLCGK